jgi:hypothetical protein
VRASILLVDVAQLLAKTMHLDAHHRVLGRIEILQRATEHIAGNVEFGELGFLMREEFRAQVFEQTARPRASPQEVDGTFEFESFRVA